MINEDQHGGRPGHSTSTCVLEVLDVVQEAQEQGYTPAVLALDLSAAFDLVDHQVLLQKLRLMNLAPHTLKFVSDFLGGRSSCVEHVPSPPFRKVGCGPRWQEQW